MSNAIPITYIKCDDWEAVYVDFQLVDQGHKVNHEKVYKVLEWRQVSCYEKIYDEDGSIVEYFGCLYPGYYGDVIDYLESKRK